MAREWSPATDEEFERQYAAAAERARVAARTQPRAVSAASDRANGRVVIELRNGCTFSVPAELCEGLRGASSDALSDVTVLGGGEALHWEELDADLGVPELLEGRFGSDRWMAQWGGSGWGAEPPPPPAERPSSRQRQTV
jgi:hypothetical protein